MVGFTGRDAELGQLRQWRDSGPRLAVRWLHGPGGQGKTRLAAQLAAESAEAGWKVVAATHGPGTVLPPPGSQDLGTDGAAGLLMVVDYADQWPLSHLTWLLSNALLHQTGVASWVLMLARTDDSWPAVRAALAGQQASTSSLFLTPLPEESRQRRDTFTAARDSFADVYRIADPAGIEPPGPLDGLCTSSLFPDVTYWHYRASTDRRLPAPQHTAVRLASLAAHGINQRKSRRQLRRVSARHARRRDVLPVIRS